jgi:hypothetical protein
VKAIIKKINKKNFYLYLDFLTMPEQIFISHSKKDSEIVDYFIDKFNDTGIKPVRMEYEKWSRA